MIIIKLLIAHFLGDFVLQPNSWVKHKAKNKLSSSRLYFHIAVHVVLAYVVLWDITLWYVPLLVGFSHLLIDAAKVELQKKKTQRLFFFIDQLLHILVIIGVWYALEGKYLALQVPDSLWLIVLCVLFLTQPTSILIKTIISIYTPKTELKKDDSLQNAGKYIGILERLLVFTFIATNHWEGVGFLIAAKSIFRFSDLTEAKDRKLTEYILIGTLLSFGIAIFVALLFLGFKA
jgi:hypothetical protein